MKFISSIILKKNGFTLVELIVGMTIFVVGMTAILVLLNSAISSSLGAKNEIIAANILREQVELIKNMRNSNVRSFAHWSVGISPNIYTVENDYSSSNVVYVNGLITASPVKLIPSTIIPADTVEQRFLKTQLYYDAKGRYTHTVTPDSTNIAAYIIISPLSFTRPLGVIEPKNTDGSNQGYILDARVIVHTNEYREYDLKTVITDWQK